MSNIAKKKNIFGRRRKTGSRVVRGLIGGVVAVVLGVFVGTGFLYVQAMPESPTPAEALEGSRAQDNREQGNRGVVVFTGGQGRVEAGFDVLDKFDGVAYLLISGVNPSTTRAEMFKHNNLSPPPENFSGQIELDYRGQTTFGNIAQTEAWAKKHNLQQVVLVTSSYHVPRAALLLKQRLPGVDVVVYPVVPEAVGWRVLLAEYLKYSAVRLNAALGGLFFADALE